MAFRPDFFVSEIEHGTDAIRITVPPKAGQMTPMFKVMAGSFVILMAAAVLSIVFGGHPEDRIELGLNGPTLFFSFMLLLCVVMLVKLTIMSAWIYTGREEIAVSKQGITVSHRMRGYRDSTTYDLVDIEGLSLIDDATHLDERHQFHGPGYLAEHSSGTIRFRHRGKMVGVAHGLSSQEARAILEMIYKFEPAYRGKATA